MSHPLLFLCSQEGVEVRVARIFNTFGSRMHMNDGRVVSNFILQALQGEPLTVRMLSFFFFFFNMSSVRMWHLISRNEMESEYCFGMHL